MSVEIVKALNEIRWELEILNSPYGIVSASNRAHDVVDVLAMIKIPPDQYVGESQHRISIRKISGFRNWFFNIYSPLDIGHEFHVYVVENGRIIERLPVV